MPIDGPYHHPIHLCKHALEAVADGTFSRANLCLGAIRRQVRSALAGLAHRLAFCGPIVQISARMDTATRRIRRRLEKDGWFLSRRGGAHDIYRRPRIEGIVTLPRRRQVTPAVARSIARKAGWA